MVGATAAQRSGDLELALHVGLVEQRNGKADWAHVVGLEQLCDRPTFSLFRFRISDRLSEEHTLLGSASLK